MNASFLRTARVTAVLLPFVVSIIRDWRRWLILGGPRILTRAQHRDRAQRMRETMGRLGPTFIKGAQVLAMREDMIHPIYAREFRKLQDQVPPFSAALADKIIARNLRRPVREVFDEFEAEPIAAASLGQVHRAVFRGETVAVKVLRPGVRQLVETDLRVITFFLGMVGLFLDENIVRSAWTILEEYRRMIFLEMDFRNEEKNAARFRKDFADQPRIRIPKCHHELTTRETAVFEFCHGVRIDDVEGMKRLAFDPKDLVEQLLEAYIRMAVVHGFVHADPHPGNILVNAEKQVVILDYGMALEFSERTRLELLKLVYCVVKRDIDGVVDSFYRLDMVDEGISRATLRDAADTLLSIQLDTDVTIRQLQKISQDILETFYKFPLRLPSQLVYLLRAATLVEGVALYYNERFNGVKESTPIVKRLLAETAFQGKKPISERVVDGAKEAYGTLRDLVQVIHRLEREQLRVRVSEVDIYAFQRFLTALLRRLMAAIGLAAFAIILAIASGGVGGPILALLAALMLVFGFLALVLIPIPRDGGRGNPYLK